MRKFESYLFRHFNLLPVRSTVRIMDFDPIDIGSTPIRAAKWKRNSMARGICVAGSSPVVSGTYSLYLKMLAVIGGGLKI